MWELDHNKGWGPKNWCFQIEVLDKTPESLLDSKEINPVNPQGNQPWMFIGMTDAEAEVPMIWPTDTKSWLIGKGPSAGKGWKQKEKRLAEDEMVRCHHRLDRYEFEQTPEDSEKQRGLACCSPWVTKSCTWLSDWTTTINIMQIKKLEFREPLICPRSLSLEPWK